MGSVTLLLSPWSQTSVQECLHIPEIPTSILWGQVAPKGHGGSSCFSFWKRVGEKGSFGRNHWAVSILPHRKHQMHPARSGMKCRWQNSLWVSPWECRKCRRGIHPPSLGSTRMTMQHFILSCYVSVEGCFGSECPSTWVKNLMLCKIRTLFKRNCCK